MASSVPRVQTDDRNANQTNSNILQFLNTFLVNNPILSGNLLTDGIVIQGATKHTVGITLVNGDNTIQHGLGRPLIGYFVTLNSAAATFYDKQGANKTTNLTLVLNSSAATSINIYVF